MATIPRTRKESKAPAFTPPSVSHEFFSQLTRPQSEFDAGINTSNAWTEHLERGSLSDDDPDDDSAVVENEEGKPARALYQFEGMAEFREISVEAGDEISVIKEDLADGWSLVRNTSGEIGLLPRLYYTVNLFFFYLIYHALI